jgi:hypothetical protein
VTQPPSIVHSQLNQVSDEEGYLFFVLGLISFSRGVIAALERERALAPEVALPDEPRGDAPGSLLT